MHLVVKAIFNLFFSQIGSLYKQSLRASKLREMVFGARDKTNNSIDSLDHVIDIDSTRPHFLAPISVNSNRINKEDIKTDYTENFRNNESKNKEGKYLLTLISPKRSVNAKNDHAD